MSILLTLLLNLAAKGIEVKFAKSAASAGGAFILSLLDSQGISTAITMPTTLIETELHSILQSVLNGGIGGVVNQLSTMPQSGFSFVQPGALSGLLSGGPFGGNAGGNAGGISPDATT
jgi:hypothetical protein